MSQLQNIYNALLGAFGPQHWWPGETPFEVMVGAILTQNTSWSNVEKAINNLKKAGSLDPDAMLELPPEGLAELIRPAGYFNVKAKRLRNFLRFFKERYDRSVKRMMDSPLEGLREELLSINGIGRETADSILLYALEKPIFVCDTYTCRVMTRHGLVGDDPTYEELQSIFMDVLPNDAEMFNEYHALLVKVGKEFCRPRPNCEKCPLSYLPF